jgi:Cu2+-exporting ATPase
MKTSVIEVHDMLSVLSVAGVEERIGKVAGVESVTVNHAAGTATVRYDETRLEIADIKAGVRQSGFEPAAPPAAMTGAGHESHGTPDAPPATAAPKPPAAAPAAAGVAPPGTAPQDKAAPDAAPVTTSPAPKSAPDALAAMPAKGAPVTDGQKDKAAPKTH